MGVREIRPFILCGGAGTRLWPLSTPARPKQFMALSGPKAMAALTADRVTGEAAGLRFLPVTAIGSARHATLLRRTLPEAGLILEPFGRNSAPAVAAASLCSASDDLVLILPADHHIADLPAFHAAIAKGAEAAREDRIVTFGITPDHPATGYGYIESNPAHGEVRPVARFVEKPDRQTAEAYLETGRYLWNGGIFLFRADVMAGALERHAPAILSAVRGALIETGPLTGGEVRALERAAFDACPSDSIDYAVMERDDRISVVPVDMGWSDLGDHGALYALSADGADVNATGPVVAHQASGFARSEGPVIALHGITDVAVIATREAVLVTRLDKTAGIRPVVEAAARLGSAAQLPADQRARVRRWLSDAVLPLWLETAWDGARGGFVESLTLDGRPQPELERRMRVIPRQIFSFSEAARLGLCDPGAARALAMNGLDYLDGAPRSALGGWVHRLTPDGGHADPRRGLYDHAFAVLAGATAFQAFRESRALDIAREALGVIDAAMRAPGGRGWRDPEMDGGERLANPHMHLLEACLALHDAAGDPDALEMAREIVLLFETAMFSPASGALIERFDEHWRPLAETDGSIRTEPGHCHEWAYLLAAFEQAEGRDLVSWRRRLIGFADRLGTDPATGFALNAVAEDGTVIDGARRLWPQLEMLRARLHHPDTAPAGAAARLLSRLEASYLSGACEGGWMDAYDADGRPAATAIPASMLYHVITALGPVAAAAD
jgi:mannose-1-phosphate guanylyltransferase/mannose-6-phosphate isomerase